MPVLTGVEVRDGDAVVVKRAAGDAADVERLRREGDRLERARHPGVVSLVRSAPHADGWELVMAHGGRCLAGLRRPAPEQVATTLAGVASTLADLHELGVVHGRVDTSHVLVGDHGRARLCGFGDADGARPEDDVASVGRLLTELLGTEQEPEPIPERRWRPRRGNGWERRALLVLADQATADDPGRRPTARRLAAAIAEAVPAAGPEPKATDDAPAPDPIEPLRPDTRRSLAPRAHRARALGLAGAGGIALVLAVTRLGSPEGAAPGQVDTAGAGVEVAAPVPGSVVVADGHRFRVGQDGDHVLVGDWRCDGRPTPAAFRPSTHEVFVFDRWTVDEPLTVHAIATVSDGVSMVAERDGDGCVRLVVETAAGAAVPIEL